MSFATVSVDLSSPRANQKTKKEITSKRAFVGNKGLLLNNGFAGF